MICTISIRWPCRLPIDRMPTIERPAIDADRRIVAALLNHCLGARMATRTQQLAQAKLRVVASMRLDVIGASGGRETAFAQAHLRHAQLMLLPLAPIRAIVPAMPLRL